MFSALPEKLRRLVRMIGDTSGNVALTAALSMPVVLAGGAIAIEMSQATQTQTRLQGIADTASIAAARELRLGNATPETIIRVAQNHVAAAAANIELDYTFNAAVSSDRRNVTINLSARTAAGIGAAIGLANTDVAVSSTAQVLGGAPVCAVALNGRDPYAIDLEKLARVEANQCAVYSNSGAANGLEARDGATLTSAFTCSSGGYRGNSSSFAPAPVTDCPVFPDPLAARPAPVFGGCDPAKQNLIISDTYLTPGVYCGGFSVNKNVIVTMQPGIYIIKDGPIGLQKGARLQGTDVGIYFTGETAGLAIKKDSSLALSAPKTGEMAGLLMFQDRNVVADNVKFEISSDDASVLLGTIYLPRGILYLGGDKPVAQKSDYTIVVANKMQLSAGSTLVLNSNYSASTVPVPKGVGPISNTVGLKH